MPKKAQQSIIPVEQIASRIYIIRGQKVMLDRDLAELYCVSTGRLNEQVKRNIIRFPKDFMFPLTKKEMENWKSQIATSNPSLKMSLRKAPLAFTEPGVAMLSSVLHSERAVEVNIGIIRTFIRMREMLATNKELARMVEKHDKEIAVLYDYLKKLLDPPKSSKRQIGYTRH